MLNVLVVDDEKFIRKGLIKIVDSISKDYAVIGEASNGVEALEFIQEQKPDLVIVDIKMPKMDGIELAAQLERTNPEIKKIILSGFDEFDYVREAMRSGAADYLLKPVDEAELAKLLMKIHEQIKNENKQRQDAINLKIKLNESLPLLKDQFLEELVCEGRHGSEDDIKEKLKDYNLCIDAGRYQVLILSIDNYRYLYNKLRKEELKIVSFIIRNITEETVSKYLTNFSFVSDMDLIIVCSITEGKDRIPVKVTNEIFNNLSKQTDVRFTLSAGHPVERFAELKTSYESASDLLKYRFYSEQSTVIRYDEAREAFIKYQLEGLTENTGHKLKNCIEIMEFHPLKRTFDEFCTVIKEKLIEPNDIVNLFAEVFMKLQMEIPKLKETICELYGSNYSYLSVISLFDSMDEIERYTFGIFEEILKKISASVNRKEKKIIEIVKDYIVSHYTEDITLNKLAEVAYINPNYLSEIFKNQTGETFVDFLTRIRIERAKELLKDIRVKAYEVAERVGYDDSAYFSKVFKKAVGVSPSEYRNLVR